MAGAHRALSSVMRGHDGDKEARPRAGCYDLRVTNRERRGALLMALACAALTGTARADDVAPSPAELGWPATTRSVEIRRQTKVLAAAGTGTRLGTIGRGARASWTQIVKTRDRCKAWVELAPRGWVCAKDLVPKDEALAAAPSTTAAVAVASTTASAPGTRYADVRKDGADAFADAASIRAGTPSSHVPDKTYVAISPNARSITVNGQRYVWTDQGYISRDRLAWQSPSSFAGIDLVSSPPPGWPFAWVVPHAHGARVQVRTTAARRGAKVRELTTRELVPVFEQQRGFARIGTDEWVELRDLRIAGLAARPPGVVAGERWVDIDLDQQTLIAYDGDMPVFATLVSTGRVKWDTPTGIYRLDGKAAKVRMQAPVGAAEAWNVAEVPYSMRFRKNFALHGTYWHDGFGRRRSHGCVNLSPHDAHELYDWTEPSVPDGWTEVEGDPRGTPVRLRSAYAPDPPWRDFDGKIIEP